MPFAVHAMKNAYTQSGRVYEYRRREFRWRSIKHPIELRKSVKNMGVESALS